MADSKSAREPETLRIHREMYERRLRDMAVREELEHKETAASPSVTEKVGTPEGRESDADKKAAYLV